MRLDQVIQRLLITEKATRQREQANEYFFAVHLRANKNLIREAVETLFGVTVIGVRTMNMQGKKKKQGRFIARRPDWKKAIVRLKEKETIKAFEGK